MHLAELKAKTPADLLSFAESLQIENASSLRKQDMMFAILKNLADNEQAIYGEGTLEILPDGFGFLRSSQANFLPGPDDIYISPNQVRRFALRTGDTVEGQIRAPKDGERYFALLKVNTINFEPPDAVKHRINFDNLTPLYPDRKLKMEVENFQSVAKGPGKDMTPRVIDLIAPIGMGQRALIVAPPRTGKTVMLQNIATAISAKPPRGVPDRAADRRAARGSHRYVPHRERARSWPAPSTSRPHGTSPSPRWSWKRPSAWSSTSATWLSCWTASPASPVPTTPSCPAPARC